MNWYRRHSPTYFIFNLIQDLNSENLGKMFFRDEYGNIIAKVNGTLSISHVKK